MSRISLRPDLGRMTAPARGWLARLRQGAAALVTWRLLQKIERQAAADLAALNDRVLADIGLSRPIVPASARRTGAADGRPSSQCSVSLFARSHRKL